MTYKKILLFGLAFLLMIASASAYSPDSSYDEALKNATVSYWTHNDADTSGSISIDIAGSNDGTLNGGVTTGVTGQINEAYSFDGTDDYVSISPLSQISISNDATFSLWFKTDSTSTGQTIIGHQDAKDSRFYISLNRNEGEIETTVYDGSSSYTQSAQYSDTNWHHITMVWDSSSYTINSYLDGSQISGTTLAFSIGHVGFNIGANSDETLKKFDGKIDEVAIFNEALTTQEVEELYKRQNASLESGQYDFMLVSIITARDTYNNSNINNFTATVNGTEYNTTTGSITTNINSDSGFTGDIEVTADNYFNRTYINYNTSNDLNAELHQSVAEITTKDKVTNNLVSNYSLDFKYDTFSTNTSVLRANLSADNHSFNFTKSLWYKTNHNIITEPLTTTNKNISVYNHKLNVTINDISGQGDTNNFSIDVYGDNYDFHETLNTTTGQVVFNLSDDESSVDYTVYLNSTQWELVERNVTLSSTGNLTNITIDAFTTNSINLQIYDEETNTILNETNFELDIIGDSLNDIDNATVTDGKYYIDLLSPDSYQIKYKSVSDQYELRKYFFTLNNKEAYNITLYAHNNTFEFIFRVLDVNDDPVENAIVKAKALFPSDDSYKTVAMCRTNYDGKCTMQLDKNKEYSYTIQKGENVVSIEPTLLYDTITTFSLTEEELLGDYFVTDGVSSSLSYDNTTDDITFTFNSLNGNSYEYCLNIYNKTSFDLIKQTCTTSSGGSIVINHDFQDTSIKVEGTVKINGKTYTLETLISDDTLNLRDKMGDLGTFMMWLLMISIILIGVRVNPSVGIISAIVVLGLGYLIGLVPIGWPIFVAMVMIGAGIAYWVST